MNSSSVRAKTYTRDEYVYLAKLYERAERFDDMVYFINKFVELNPTLSHEERNILSAGYKNMISDKRASWRLLNLMEKKDWIKIYKIMLSIFMKYRRIINMAFDGITVHALVDFWFPLI